MTLLRPTATPLFATDPTFSSGSEIGLSTRQDPGAGIRGQGVLAESRFAARALNHEIGTHGDWLAYLDKLQLHQALSTWKRATEAAGTSGLVYSQVVGIQIVRGFDTNNQRQRMPVILGPNPAVRLTVAVSNDGSVMETGRIQNAGTIFTPSCAAAGRAGEIVTGDSATSNIQYSTDNGNSFALTATAFQTAAVHYVATSNVYLRLDTHGQLFVSTTLPIFSGVTLSGVTAADSNISEFADDGGLNVVLVSRVSGHGYPSIYRSADGGATWALSTTAPAAFYANVTYNAALGAFFLWTDDGVLSTSTTGVTWTTIRSGLTGAQGFMSGNKTFASAGPALVKAFDYVGAFAQRGILYSLDGGQNWNTWAFAEAPAGGRDLVQIRGFNNRIYATDGIGLWSSGVLGAPGTEF